MNYYIADCHFGHSSALSFDRRPFADVQQMEQTMVERWNGTVHNNDTVYILGDFCWGKAEEWLRLLRKLKGQKVLIQGNHDLKEYPEELRREFLDIQPYMEISDYSQKGRPRRVILSHYPMLLYKHSCYGKYCMLCGHVHVSAENDILEKWIRELREIRQNGPKTDGLSLGQVYNVGCMMPWMDYTPRTLEQIVNGWEQFHQ